MDFEPVNNGEFIDRESDVLEEELVRQNLAWKNYRVIRAIRRL